MGVGVAAAAVAHGATLVDKHFTLSRADGGIDSIFSLEPAELEQLVIETKRAWQSFDQVTYDPSESEKDSVQYRQSIYIYADMRAGDEFTPENIRIVRLGHGLEPKYFEMIIGKKVKNNVSRGTALTWDLVV